MNAEELSDTFVSIIQNWLTEEELSELRDKNEKLINSKTCASHDYCDPNQAMVEALEKHEIEVDIQNDHQLELVDKAWNTAKQNDFFTRDQQLRNLGFPMLADWIEEGEIKDLKKALDHIDENRYMIDDEEDRKAFKQAEKIVITIFDNN